MTTTDYFQHCSRSRHFRNMAVTISYAPSGYLTASDKQKPILVDLIYSCHTNLSEFPKIFVYQCKLMITSDAAVTCFS